VAAGLFNLTLNMACVIFAVTEGGTDSDGDGKDCQGRSYRISLEKELCSTLQMSRSLGCIHLIIH
jgi:hypothetical protein